ncbi:penicillin-insensitive murein endopeptidase [Zooshikella ganghwensis]|uniref:SH3b domain-containing protein n=1 Tax=Zooshikella ganghwensis TaxID=202772 RepID=A0A4P9VL42_9GAMM|nr:penicillin-insensitive murein endopeptidase [Zooshikella ganghwensis]RDH44055.1 hypothetical protein B9G39_11680 [Zooshikella ganghwensis]
MQVKLTASRALLQKLTLVLLYSFSLISVSAYSGQSIKVNATALNVRSGPGTQHKIIGRISQDQVYVSIAKSSGWHKIWINNQAGWVYGQYVVSSSLPNGVVTATQLKVRSGPGTSYRVVNLTSKGAEWAYSIKRGPWFKIFFNGNERWVHGKYLNGVSSSRPKSKTSFIQMPAGGRGFYTYTSAKRAWGKPRLVYGLQRVAAAWKKEKPTWGEIGIGDISFQKGGFIRGHASHRKGIDVDIRLIRKDGLRQGSTIYKNSYSYKRSREFLNSYLQKYFKVNLVFFNDKNMFSMLPRYAGKRRAECRQKPGKSGLSYVMCWPNHHDHFHLRIN